MSPKNYICRYGNLLKEQAVGANHRTRMDYNSVWMGQQQPTLDLAVKRYVRTSNHRPKEISENARFGEPPPESTSLSHTLIVANRFEEFAARIPKPHRSLAVPVRRIPAWVVRNSAIFCIQVWYSGRPERDRRYAIRTNHETAFTLIRSFAILQDASLVRRFG